MAENSTIELTSKQRKALAAIAGGCNLEDAALAAQVSSRTLYRWLEQSLFVSELRKLQRISATEHMSVLSAELTRNRTVMTGARDDIEAPWAIRLRAAQALENSLLMWRESTDFEERLAALEAAYNAE